MKYDQRAAEYVLRLLFKGAKDAEAFRKRTQG